MKTRSRSILVLGAGPAGLSAALWLGNLGLDFVVLEREGRLGGMQNYNFLGNGWVLGQVGQTGPMMAEKFAAHVLANGARIQTQAPVDGVEVESRGDGMRFRVRFRQTTAGFDAILIATGTRFRAEEVLHEVAGYPALPKGAITYGPYAFGDAGAAAGKRVLIVGGGDNAYENARLLDGVAAHVHVVMRSRPRAQQYLLDAVAQQEKQNRCRVLEQTRIASFAPGAEGISVGLERAGATEHVTVDRIHVLTGYEPNTRFIGEAFPAQVARDIALDAEGYIKVDAECRTGHRGIYAAGDVCNPVFPCVVSAMAQGALAAKTIERDLRRLAS